MKTLLATLCCISVLLCQAQLKKLPSNSYFTTGKHFASHLMEYQGAFEDENTVQHQKNAGLKSLQVTHTKKGKVTYTSNQSFDDQGRIIHLKTSNGFTHNVKYKDGKAVQYTSTKNDKLFQEYLAVRENNKLTQFTIKRKGKHISTKKIDRKSNQIVSSTMYVKNKKTPLDSSICIRHDDNSMKQLERYRKGKLKSKYLFDCDAKGTNSKTEILSCHYNSQSVDGSFIEYFRETRDGKETLTEYHYSKDSLQVAYFRYNEKEELTYSSELKNSNTVIYTSYKNGSPSYVRKQTYDMYGNVVNRTVNKINQKGESKLSSDYSYKYNDKNLMEERVNNRLKKPSKYKTTYQYTFYE